MSPSPGRPARKPRPAERRGAGAAGAAGAILGGIFGERPAVDCRARGRAAVRLRRPADLHPRQRARPVPVRQRPAGARPAAAGALRGAYADFLARDRHPLAALYVDARSARGGRQRASGQGRGALPRSRPGARPDHRRPAPRAGRRRPPRATTGGAPRCAAFRPGRDPPALERARLARAAAAGRRRRSCRARNEAPGSRRRRRQPSTWARRRPTRASMWTSPRPISSTGRSAPPARRCTRPISWRRPATASSSSTSTPRTSGIVYERLKAALEKTGVARQILLIPEIVELDPADAERVVARAEELAALGLDRRAFGPGASLVRETPVSPRRDRRAGLVRDIADDLAERRGAGARRGG